MATYATAADLEAFAQGVGYDDRIPDAPDEVERLLEQAERDLDSEAWPLEPRRPGLPKRDPAELDGDEERQGLVAAVCAQAVYRIEMGDEFFVRAQRQRVSTRAVTTEGKLPILGPMAERELVAAGLFRLTTSVGGRGHSVPWQRR